MSKVRFTVRIQGQAFNVVSLSVTGSSYGSVGHATIRTSQMFLAQAGIDLYDISTSSAGITEVLIDASIDGNTTRIFGGEYLSACWDMDHDAIDLHVRSWAGVLVDQKRILTKIAGAIEGVLKPLSPGQVNNAGIANENQTISNIVTSIANEFGFTPVLNLSNGNPMVGTLYQSTDQSFLSVPQSLWSVLNQMARDTGYVVYDTPAKQLVFGVAGAGEAPINLSYKENLQGRLPAKLVKLEHHPRRNSTFRVMVISYDPANRHMAIGKATYVGRNFANSNGLTPGIASGPAAQANEKQITALNATTGAIPLYTFHHDGLTLAQANTLAAGIATDIAKREVLLSATIDGLPDVTPTQKVNVRGQVPAQFAGVDFYISGYTHTFSMPARYGAGRAGFFTEIKGLNIPTEALAVENSG